MNLLIMASDFGLEDPDSIPDATKNPQCACGLRSRKIRGSESPLVGQYQFTIVVVSEEKFPSPI